ncbi:helix-turn-helix domain-containing protein [Streptomyces sp. NPDC007856]|uniref:helix-turn-helix domain-containing protein n=1 Tax=Streptomyces sp. NPDC007856 TaxID=3364781 RepID=UPI00369C162C
MREQLIHDAKAAAREIAATEGLDGLTLAEVARRVGVSSPALYRYFGGRPGLIRALWAASASARSRASAKARWSRCAA